MLWNNVYDGYKFNDGSVITQIHDTHKSRCYSIRIKGESRPIVLSEDHIILTDITGIGKDATEYCIARIPDRIVSEADIHFMLDKSTDNVLELEHGVRFDNTRPVSGKNIFWLPIWMIFLLYNLYPDKRSKIRPISDIDDIELLSKIETSRIADIRYVGERECFCVSTNTSRYSVCGIINHNSVTLRNIIFHTLTHSDDMKLCMIDLKLSEFSRYKGMNNVVGVANSTREAAELLRLCREVMQKRNKQNADRDLTDFKDYKSTSPTDKISIYGREFNENTKFPVTIGDEKKEMTAQEILEWVSNNYN